MKILANLQNTLAYDFRDIDLLRQALSHSSWAHEKGEAEKHNERLEFLGDAVLELCVSTELYTRFPEEREGALTAMRSSLVGEKSLAGIARDIGVDKYLRLGLGEEKQGGRKRDSLLADALEAILGAVFLDGGFAGAQKVIAALFSRLWPDANFTHSTGNSKSMLQEICQKKFSQLPRYIPLESDGPAHDKIFAVRVMLPDGREFTARASSQKKAEQACASLAMEAMKQD